MTTRTIVFIGGGNMATSLISGLRQAGWPGQAITVVDRNSDKRTDLAERFDVQVAEAASAECLNADAVVLAVKPQVMAETARALAPLFGDAHPLILSIAAGIPLDALRDWMGADFAYIRCMPNTPSLLGVGATGLYADATATTEQRQLADDIMATAGLNAWVDDESLIDAVIATSGSGPAYFFAFMEAMIAGAKDLGLDEAAARELVLQTALGAARMATESGDDPTTLRQKVTSKGGTTAAALAQFEQGDLNQLVAQAMHAASDRASELARDLSDS
ncbi:pyrroline-5-carboxylate reductase [Salinisphaera sp. SPP-AMP-43]|uniref:pyrroline-5-carboxylate reductase n=1 Tax=Salinisphaera sp. SPP-AMP-43 TaxID=3121288 RepID=UPI003C6E74F6